MQGSGPCDSSSNLLRATPELFYPSIRDFQFNLLFRGKLYRTCRFLRIPWCSVVHNLPISTAPATRAGSSSSDITREVCPGSWFPGYTLLPRHPVHRIVVKSPGGGPGRQSQRPFSSLPHLAPRSSGIVVVKSPGKAGPIVPLSASSHAPDRGEHHLGEGPGREPPPRRREPCRPFPQGPRAGAGNIAVRARGGRGQEADPYIAILSPPPRPRLRRSSPAQGRGQCR